MPHKKTKHLNDVVPGVVNLEILEGGQFDPWEIPFPLPEQEDPSMCRDEFLKDLIREHESRVASLVVRSTMRDASTVKRPVELQDSDVKEAEAMVVLQMAKKRQRTSVRRTMEEVIASIRLRSTIIADLIRQIQKAAIEFLSVRLLRQLRLFSMPWPGELEETPNNLFSWSLDDFLFRLDVKQMYLDVLHRERSVKDLDCVKFCKDLSEIEHLIQEMRRDFRDDVDLCENSLRLLKNAQYHINAPWVKSLNANIQNLASSASVAMLNEQSGSLTSLRRNSSAMIVFERKSAMNPIETRYQINWFRSCTDQRLTRMNGRNVEIKKELHDLEVQAVQDEKVQYSSGLMYELEVGKLRESIRNWQDRLDTDLEHADVMCTVSRLALQKVKDDLKFYMEQKNMYLQRIEEVQALIDQERMIREERELAALKRMSRGSLRKSVPKATKNFQKKSKRKSEKKSEMKSEVKSDIKPDMKTERKSDVKAERKSQTMLAEKSQRKSTNSKIE
ncbi:uncharacterized protein LOC6732696 [Drosophila simulans]|uniref:Uncharacterized protein n=1 Tax=Drosophila simulans TaxID=7240 RepID=A0A0J9R3L3_DROSI|nr:uncharacterized protein LOC6732696 [Drosophila simulans]KMY90852.1 uncharacterized protein Dsimw501_GD21821 [Drosophila simulans]